MQAHSVTKNNYLKEGKSHTIFTPPAVCEWIAKIVEPEMEDVKIVFDPACGSGNLLAPFKDKIRMGADIFNFDKDEDIVFLKGDFLDWKKDNYGKVDFIPMNPPYNHTDESRAKWGRSTLFPELFADKCFELFGKDVKMILFTPMGLRLNTRCNKNKQGERYKNIRDNWGEITSIVSLPLDLFPNPDFDPNYPEHIRDMKKFKRLYPRLKEDDPIVQADPVKYFVKANLKRKETQQEILFFNMPKLKPHYCLPESVIEGIREEDRARWA